ncbi:predicted protein [Histoplasma capsulatum H143]|uniref:Uncharacterized protein n=1 Tax=Ajellomyces capsulatus (strain H143) TaxID=544712 RepID=C6HFL5_AJECH|nr:predicted protein [Histoplasma capsulatum H143]
MRFSQLQAKVYSPGAMLLGILKWKTLAPCPSGDRILSERELARSTTMHGAPDEAQGLCLTNGVDVFRGHYASAGSVRLAKLAREISSTGIERTIVQSTGVEWSGRANLHMSIDGACRQQSGDSSHKFRGKLHG